MPARGRGTKLLACRPEQIPCKAEIWDRKGSRFGEGGKDMKTRSYWLTAPLLAGIVAVPLALPPAAAKPLLSQQAIFTTGGGNRCLGAAGSPTEPDIVTFPCTGHPDQLWTMTNKGELVNQNNQ